MAAQSARKLEPWQRRLFVPNYQVGEAAKYAKISAKTVADWHKVGARQTLSVREKRAALSYMQLIEVAVVAAFRRAGIRLNSIRNARDYISKELKSEFPFAEHRFKADGHRLVMDYQQIIGERGNGKVLRPDQSGQLAWEHILGRLEEFEYERRGIVVKWHIDGPSSPIVIDPRVAFGAPSVGGTPTWVIKGRWSAGETVEEIADDFGIDNSQVAYALKFEGIENGMWKWLN
ncbi:DUF433 domain-containing protein [Oceanibaculum nanhaiense]|uniref:DUF433 domain-containing protein n=1 Tax=Oceanibaculum nanhaiense TaxID=1909734 RepID=UPI000A3BF216|nr:DUF433 domain-containing protein [Oceanibaculum nanhaiense]